MENKIEMEIDSNVEKQVAEALADKSLKNFFAKIEFCEILAR